MAAPLLYLTDGTTVVDFLSPTSGFHLGSWVPSRVQPKGGGVFEQSPLSDGRRLAQRVWDLAGESFALVVNGSAQDSVIADSRNLSALLLKSDSYWLSDGNLGGPVWIAKRASCETNTSYALIHSWNIPNEGGQILQPPFDASILIALDEFTLNFERGHWLENPPGTATCVQISGQGSWYLWGANQLENPGFETAGGGGADVFGSWAETAGDGTIVRDLAVFHATSPAGVASARLTSGATSNTVITQNQAGLTPGDTATLGFWTRGSGAVAGRYAVYDVTNAAYILGITSTGITAATFAFVFYQFVLPAGCTEVRIELRCPDTNGIAAYFDDTDLRVRGAATTPGRAATCTNEVYITNKRTTAQLTDIYYWDNSITTYSANLINAAVPFAFLPAVPAANDAVYFGIDAGVPGTGPFDNLVFDISAAIGAAVTGTVWENWDGAAWQSLAAVTQDNTNQSGAGTGVAFDTLGVNQVVSSSGNDVTTINGINAYWIRLRVTVAGGGATPPSQANRAIYTAVWPYVSIDNAQVGGDLPALMETLLHNSSDSSAYIVWAGLRSNSRGTDFTAFLNASSNANPTGITVSLGAATAFVQNAYPLFYNNAAYTPAGVEALADRVTFTLSGTMIAQYWGKFRVFVRVSSNVGGAIDDATFRLVARYGSTGVSYTSSTITEAVGGANNEIVDLGNIDIMGGNLLASGETFDQVTIALQVGCTDGAPAGTVEIYDLVLLPLDEWACQAGSVDATLVALGYTDYLMLDSIEVPHLMFRSLECAESDGDIISYWRPIYTSPAILEVNADQKLWFLTAGNYVVTGIRTSFGDAYSVQMFRNQRYFGLRGAS